MPIPWKTRRRQFSNLALPLLPATYRFALQIAGPQAAEDLVQETYLRAWKYFSSFDPASNCKAWLFRILRNVWINHWHRASLELPLPDVEEKAIEPYYDWEDDLLANQLSAGMEHALRQLPKEYLWTLLLADVEEFSYSEIAQLMDCPIGTVMSRLNRARRTLARILRSDDAQVTTARSFRNAGEH